MKRILLFPLFFAFVAFLGSAPTSHAALSDQVAAANAALAAGHPLEALDTYKALLSAPELAGSGSSELWYNRGLAEEKNGDAAAASLSFRRALLLDPGFAPARRQLAAMLGLLGLQAPMGWKETLSEKIHPEIMILGGAVVGWIGALLFVVLWIAGPRRKSWILFTLFLFVFGHGCSILGTWIDPRRTASKEAVVVAKSGSPLKETPADTASSLTVIPPGTLITILSRNGAWWYITAGRHINGWITSDTALPLIPSR